MTERISLEDAHASGLPVVKRTAIGQTFKGALVKVESRDRTKMGVGGVREILYKPDGKARQELVVTCLTLPGTTAPAGLGDYEEVPEPGALVRLILKGKAFGDWIDAKKTLPGETPSVGDVVTTITKVAQVYDANGNPSGGEISDQSAVVDARQRGRSVGIYGPLTLAVPDAKSEWTDKAIAAYKSMQEPIPAEAPRPDPWGPAPQPTGSGPAKPASISDAAWAAMDDSTKKAVANTMSEMAGDTPPF